MNEKLSKMLKVIAFFQIIFYLFIIASPFVWIWTVWDFAWKVGLTGIVGLFMTSGLSSIFTNGKIGNEKIESQIRSRNKFQERPDQAIKEKSNK